MDFDPEKRAVAEALRAFVEAFNNLDWEMLADAAVVTFHFDRGPSSVGRRTLVWQKQEDKWLIVHLHASNIELDK